MQNCIGFCPSVCDLPLPIDIHAEKEHQHDPDDDSGVGPSISTDTRSTNFSEVSYYSSTVVWPLLYI